MTSTESFDNVFLSKAVIQPPENLMKQYRVKHVLIDSRDRNYDLYPNPSKYEIEFHEAFLNVHSIELTVSNIPFNQYNVTAYNNKLTVNDVECTIEPGKYTANQLIEALNTALRIDYFSYNEITNKVSITAQTVALDIECKSDTKKRYDTYNEVYVDTYKENSIAKLLGFDMADYKIEMNTTLVLPNPMNLMPYADYIAMYIQRAKLYVSRNDYLNDSFAILRPSTHDNYTIYGDEIKAKVFNPPIDIKKIRFSFKDYDGHPYDFQNKEHSFELKITSHRIQPKYSNIFK